MRVLELLLRIILRLIDILSKPTSSSDEGNSTEVDDAISQAKAKTRASDEVIEHRTSSQSSINANNSSNNIVVMTDEVNSLITEIMETNTATHDADMREIARLRSEVSRLQRQLLMAKADSARLRNRSRIDDEIVETDIIEPKKISEQNDDKE